MHWQGTRGRFRRSRHRRVELPEWSPHIPGIEETFPWIRSTRFFSTG